MNENRKRIMKYFAGVLRTRANEKSVGSGADLSLLKYLSRKQLIEIIKNAHDGTLPKDLNLVELENRELLFQVKDEMHVLAYFVSQWCKEEVVPQKMVVSSNQKNKDDGKSGTSVSK